jgi:lipopolysaccharide/colanic/teichoic acid biosynthesis glycosyltransferase
MLLAEEGVAPGHRLLDGFVAGCGLLVLTPILACVGASIVLETGFPILFTQDRIGRRGKPFRLKKFRTMRPGKKGTAITVSGDSRITRVGRFLRKFKLDELPQLWNVVRGDMSLVGPRPEVPEFVDFNEPMWRAVLQARPGITDPASIAYRDEETLLAGAADPIAYYRECVLPAKLALNVEYLKKRTIASDFKVILQTIRCALLPGAMNINPIPVIPKDSK